MLDLVPAGSRIIDMRSGRQLDQNELSRFVHSRMEVLADAGVRGGDLVAMCHRDGIVLLVDLFAVWQLGAAGLVLSPSLTDAERRRIADFARPACWIGE